MYFSYHCQNFTVQIKIENHDREKLQSIFLNNLSCGFFFFFLRDVLICGMGERDLYTGAVTFAIPCEIF